MNVGQPKSGAGHLHRQSKKYNKTSVISEQDEVWNLCAEVYKSSADECLMDWVNYIN
jgi:hypothetical protein